MFGARITPTQIAIIAAAMVAMLAFYLLLSRTRLGIAMRATADNAPLSQASGIHSERIIRAVWFIGSGFAALGGVLIGLNTQVKPDMGFGLIIEVFAAAIVGGIGIPYGAMLGALLVGFAENVGLAINWAPLLRALGFDAGDFVFIPTGYKAAVAFSLLILTLLLRPRGILGARMTEFLVYLATIAGIWGILSLSLNVQFGIAGLVNLGHVAFFMLGAYTSTILVVIAGLPIGVGMIAGAVAAALFGMLMALPAGALQQDYWGISTLAAAEIVRHRLPQHAARRPLCRPGIRRQRHSAPAPRLVRRPWLRSCRLQSLLHGAGCSSASPVLRARLLTSRGRRSAGR